VKRLNGMGLHTVRPEGAFYAFANIGGKNSLRFANDLLNKGKVAAIPGSEFGANGEGYIRLSFATDYQKIKIAMDRMENFLRK
jgi:aspartate/methionine/tyrosine aminotransferase